MDTSDEPRPTDHATAHPSGRIDGWRDFEDRLRAALAMGSTEPADWRLSDPDFGQWPLGERALVEVLQQGVLAHPRTHLTVLAARFDEFPRKHPRWLAWRQNWSHRVRCLQANEEDASQQADFDVISQRSAEAMPGTTLGL